MFDYFLELPTQITIGETVFNIASKGDWRTLIKCSNALAKKDVPNEIKVPATLCMFYEELTIEDIYDLDKKTFKTLINSMYFVLAYGNMEVKKKVKPTMNYEKDIKLILQAISATHAEIRSTTSVNDLDSQGFPKNYLHWWTFLDYLMGTNDQLFNKITSIRYKMNNGKKLSKEEKEFATKNKDLIKI